MKHTCIARCAACVAEQACPVPPDRGERLYAALHLTPRHYSEISVVFMRGMAARMALSMEKYGRVADSNIDHLKSAQTRIEKYLATGNIEYLIDAGNFMMMEFMKPTAQGAHFRPTDSDESPGRTATGGRDIGQTANTTGHENIRLGGSNMRTDGGFYKREGD